ncbi:hypothetical protein RHSIM_Rhsim07G0147500 [Rhododendron simsii]|uniref:Uncharacterized protein n=1 Tax=Rhododendron simsii TaxID=118357 RepID=A0A834GMT1_RHOSS|nr:hypothetical protein RHSIM_Rhsim07G0147500 [Rhododendron simsii]
MSKDHSELNSSLAKEPPDRVDSGVSKVAANPVSKGSAGFNKFLSKSAKKSLKKQAKEDSLCSSSKGRNLIIPSNDLMIFCKGEISSINHIRNALAEFEALSGNGKQITDLEQATRDPILQQGDSSKSSSLLIKKQQAINSVDSLSKSKSEGELLDVLEGEVKSSHEVSQPQFNLEVMLASQLVTQVEYEKQQEISAQNGKQKAAEHIVAQVGNGNLMAECVQPPQVSIPNSIEHSNGEELSDSEDELLEVLEGVVSSKQEVEAPSQSIAAKSLIAPRSELEIFPTPEPPDHLAPGVTGEPVNLYSNGDTGFNKHLSKSTKRGCRWDLPSQRGKSSAFCFFCWVAVLRWPFELLSYYPNDVMFCVQQGTAGNSAITLDHRAAPAVSCFGVQKIWVVAVTRVTVRSASH